nr:lysozyme inhibitor LprI family protein [Moraxella lacunata]
MNDEKEQKTNLNQVYQQTLRKLPIAKKMALRKSQRVWLRKMEAECAEFHNQSLYGREGIFETIQCRMDAMEERTIFLINYH